jgi:hypothetical protein
MPTHLERQPWPVGVADVDAEPIGDVGHGDALTVDVHPVERAVVDGQPPTLVEPQDQVGA